MVCTIEDFAVKLLTFLVLVMLHASHNGQASVSMSSYMLVIGVWQEQDLSNSIWFLAALLYLHVGVMVLRCLCCPIGGFILGLFCKANKEDHYWILFKFSSSSFLAWFTGRFLWDSLPEDIEKRQYLVPFLLRKKLDGVYAIICVVETIGWYFHLIWFKSFGSAAIWHLSCLEN